MWYREACRADVKSVGGRCSDAGQECGGKCGVKGEDVQMLCAGQGDGCRGEPMHNLQLGESVKEYGGDAGSGGEAWGAVHAVGRRTVPTL